MHSYTCNEILTTMPRFFLFNIASLPQNISSPMLVSQRRIEIEKAKGNLVWRNYPVQNELGYGLPAFLDLPSFGAPPILDKFGKL